ncbi:MAG: ABC transporter substrate-binding protein [Lacrimispora sp.]
MKKKTVAFIAGTMILGAMISGCSTKKDSTQSTLSLSSEVSQTSASPASEAPQTSAVKTGYPITVETKGSDFVTVGQTFNKAPDRVVTANASSIELLYSLGLSDKIVGTIAIDNAPGDEWKELYDSLDILGDKMTISKEVIAAAEPDVIIGRSATFAEGTFGSIPELNELGINVYAQKASDMSTDVSMENIIDDVTALGEIFDVQDRADAYAETLTERLNTVSEKVAASAGGKTLNVLVMATYKEGTFVVFGANAKLQNGMLSALNCVNVMDKGGSNLTLENLVEANPDVIIYITADRNAENDAKAVESMKSEEILASIPAVVNNRIIEVPYDAFMDYGVRNFDTLEELSDFLYN